MGLAAGATGVAGAALANGKKALSGDKKHKSGAYAQQHQNHVYSNQQGHGSPKHDKKGMM